MDLFKPKLIHVACIQDRYQGWIDLLLRQLDSLRYMWFYKPLVGDEVETAIWGATSEEAILAAYKNWKFHHIRTLHCGFRYLLPERDEVGTNALFHQMVSSYTSMNGVYFDEELESNCIVQNASAEALNLWRRFQSLSKI